MFIKQLLPFSPPVGKPMVVSAKFNTLKHCWWRKLASQARIYFPSTHCMLASVWDTSRCMVTALSGTCKAVKEAMIREHWIWNLNQWRMVRDEVNEVRGVGWWWSSVHESVNGGLVSVLPSASWGCSSKEGSERDTTPHVDKCTVGRPWPGCQWSSSCREARLRGRQPWTVNEWFIGAAAEAASLGPVPN